MDKPPVAIWFAIGGFVLSNLMMQYQHQLEQKEAGGARILFSILPGSGRFLSGRRD